VNQSLITEADFVLGGMHIDVDHRRLQLEVKHKSRMAAVKQDVPVSLLHRMRDQLVANHTTVNEKVLKISLAAGKGWQSNPPPKFQTGGFGVNHDCIVDKLLTTQRRNTPFFIEF
jgi:hypothetical protein